MHPLPKMDTGSSDALLASAASSSAASTNVSSKPAIDSDQTTSLNPPNAESSSSKTLISASSVESFKSAQSIQDLGGDIDEKNNAVNNTSPVNGILHAFKSALEVFDNLVDKRILGKDEELWTASRALKKSLADGITHINADHNAHYYNHGKFYIDSFNEDHNVCLESINSNISEKAIRVLHEQSIQDGTLQKIVFNILAKESDACRLRTLAVFRQVISSIQDSPASKGVPLMAGFPPGLTRDGIISNERTSTVEAPSARFRERWQKQNEAESARLSANLPAKEITIEPYTWTYPLHTMDSKQLDQVIPGNKGITACGENWEEPIPSLNLKREDSMASFECRHPSKLANERCAPNAGASARFRERRKQKEKEAQLVIQELTAKLNATKSSTESKGTQTYSISPCPPADNVSVGSFLNLDLAHHSRSRLENEKRAQAQDGRPSCVYSRSRRRQHTELESALIKEGISLERFHQLVSTYKDDFHFEPEEADASGRFRVRSRAREAAVVKAAAELREKIRLGSGSPETMKSPSNTDTIIPSSPLLASTGVTDNQSPLEGGSVSRLNQPQSTNSTDLGAASSPLAPAYQTGELGTTQKSMKPVAIDRWAQIRQNAIERAKKLSEGKRGEQSKTPNEEPNGESSGEETIEARVARIKARVAELIGTPSAGSIPQPETTKSEKAINSVGVVDLPLKAEQNLSNSQPHQIAALPHTDNKIEESQGSGHSDSRRKEILQKKAKLKELRELRQARRRDSEKLVGGVHISPESDPELLQPGAFFFSARAVPRDLEITATDTLPPSTSPLPPFDPLSDSPSIRKTPGIDHTKTQPLTKKDLEPVQPVPSPNEEVTNDSTATVPALEFIRKELPRAALATDKSGNGCEDAPLHVNVKQFNRILRRRVERQTVMEAIAQSKPAKPEFQNHGGPTRGSFPGPNSRLPSSSLPVTSVSDDKKDLSLSHVEVHQEVVDSESLPQSKTPPKGANTDFKKLENSDLCGEAVAIHKFEATNNNELPLEIGDRVFISYRYGTGWVVAKKANNGGRTYGVVPETHVRMLKADNKSIEASDTKDSKEDENATQTTKKVTLPPLEVFITQRRGLWWQSYLSFRNNTDLSIGQLKLFMSLNQTISYEFGCLTSTYNSDADIRDRVSTLISRASAATPNDVLKSTLIPKYREDILQVLKSIDSNPALETVTLAWACVTTFLALYDPLLSSTLPVALSPADLSTLETSFQQLHNITAIIARHASAETYLSETQFANPELQTKLLDLNTTVLEWFAHAFIIAKELGDFPVQNEMPQYPPASWRRVPIGESVERCAVLVREEIEPRHKDFMELVRDWEEEVLRKEVERDDISDGGWEVVEDEELLDEGVVV